MPVLRSPVDFFRELLAMSPAERALSLTNRTAPQRAMIDSKLQEYAGLAPDEREVRLQATQLRWYLLPLMQTPPQARTNRLALMPPEDRKLVESRLEQWDALSAEQQRRFLEHEAVLGWFARLEGAPEEQRLKLLAAAPPQGRDQLEADLARWQGLPAERQHEMLGQFQSFFELNPRERERVLNVLSEAERRQMEKSLERFASLPADQRVRCLQAFAKLASLSAEERAQFLRSAQKWQAMTPNERAIWRQLVNRVPVMPPLPPGAGRPPLPPGFGKPPLPPSQGNATFATNR
jgi:hypothetical protein